MIASELSPADSHNMLPLNRRDFLHRTGLAVSAAALGVMRLTARAAPGVELLETQVISRQPEFYLGWPTLMRAKSGMFYLVYSGGREQHVCPFGRVEMMVSRDEGQTWGWPQVLADSAIDDRDAGLLETSRGTLLVSWFTSLAYQPILAKARTKKPGEAGAWSEARLTQWQAAHERLTETQRTSELGHWMVRSTDGGVTWSARYPSIVNSPHGPIQLADGRLLYPGVELWTKARRVGVCESVDDGQTWRWLAAIPARPGDDAAQYHELHGVEAGDSRIVVHIRNHNRAETNETLQTESTDGGRTWSVPRAIGVWGLPSFLMRLRDGNLLMTYGHRRKPFGNQARLSTDAGRTWSEPLIISGDAPNGDLGYPSTVELKDGSLLTVWYEAVKSSEPTVLRQARWRLRR